MPKVPSEESSSAENLSHCSRKIQSFSGSSIILGDRNCKETGSWRLSNPSLCLIKRQRASDMEEGEHLTHATPLSRSITRKSHCKLGYEGCALIVCRRCFLLRSKARLRCTTCTPQAQRQTEQKISNKKKRTCGCIIADTPPHPAVSLPLRRLHQSMPRALQ
jgi:hypothetical protein